MSLDEQWDSEPGSAPATERPEGTTLRVETGGKRLEPRRALLIIRQVLEALAASHAAGLVHGDITPEHILILPGLGDDRVKVTDRATAAPPRTGDPVYSAPESALGAIDKRADLYSTGAVLFELLTGHPPFFADDPDALRRLHAYAPMQTLKQRVPDATFIDVIETLVATALEKNRDARYQSATDMITAVEGALDAVEDALARSRQPVGGEPALDQNDSILLLAKHLMPPTPNVNAPLVPNNVARQVPKLSWATRAGLAARRGFAHVRALADKLGLPARLARLTRKQRRAIALAAAALGLLLVVTIVTCGGDKPTRPTNVDSVSGWIHDLEQAKTCDQRRDVIHKLSRAGDPRALPALQKAKAQTCVEPDATAAIERITNTAKSR